MANITDKEIVPFLATPVLIVGTDFRLTGSEKDVIMRETKSDPQVLSNKGVKVTKNHRLLEEPGLQRLSKFMQDYTKQFVREDLKILDEFYMTSSWATLNSKGDAHHGHTHPNTLLSAVFYAQAKSGQLVVSATDNGFTPNFDFRYNIESYNVFNAKSWNIPVKTGDMVIFPGWLNHHTTPNEEEEPRIAVGANFFTRGTFGRYEDTDLLEVR
jgi:uncharacterized protein (TIGR02466 family)|tara:strand:- start:21 stop:659 length:639 start_codon:yes stop_codon:yes gene_type:complete